jgi:hypothetical protein
VSVEDFPRKRPWYKYVPMRSSPRSRRTCVRQVALTTREVLALRSVFPRLALLLATQHIELQDLPVAVRQTILPISDTTDVATITPVPKPYSQQVCSGSFILWGNMLLMAPALFLFGGSGLLALSWCLASEDSVALSVALLVFGAAGFVWGVYTGLCCPGTQRSRWIERRLCRAIACRPDPLVDARDPDRIFVSFIPREYWSMVKSTASPDLLLMRIDQERRQVLLEGDYNRYRIPAGAIAQCGPECFFHVADIRHRNELWMVRLLVAADGRLHELLLSIVHLDWRPHTNDYRKTIAEEVCQRITGLRGVSENG